MHVGGMQEFKLLFMKLRRLLYSRGFSGDDSDDLIQEAFLRLQQYRRAHVVNHDEAFLVRSVLNLLADHRKKRRHQVLDSSVLEALPLIDPGPSLEAMLEGNARLRHFKTGLRNLSPRCREVFILNRIAGYSFTQISKELGITVSTAEKHAARALLLLGDWMAGYDDEDAGSHQR